ncbi:MAG: radical SAM protein [Promethearchaeota archaeon]
MDKIRLSAGSAAILGLHRLKMVEKPTTVHLLQYSPDGCKANCAFCPQARDAIVDKKWLSRVSWPEFQWRGVKERLLSTFDDRAFFRVCLQTVVYPSFLDDMFFLIEDLLETRPIPVSVALTPVHRGALEKLHDLGVDRVGIALDAATPSLFSRIKGAQAGGFFTWEKHWSSLRDAISVFGRGKVTTHQIVGLGETEREIMENIQMAHDEGISIGLFAFTPVKGTRLFDRHKPLVDSFRRVQLGRYLIVNSIISFRDLSFNDATGGVIGWGMPVEDLSRLIRDARGRMFETTGCPGCNRPYYTSAPGGTTYNYPSKLTREQVESAIQILLGTGGGERGG